MNDLAPYQSDHLILLIGGNPLPNAVAAQLLAAPDATIWLLHSVGDDGKHGTKSVAENLETFLHRKNANWSINLEPLPSADKIGIENRVRKILGKGGSNLNGRMGLHYTGGTKSMSVHVYRIMEQVLADKFLRPTFSYLDPNKLALRIDGYNTDPGHLIPLIKDNKLRQKLSTSPDDLAELHGYMRMPHEMGWADPDTTPGLIELCQEIANLNSTEKGFRAWLQWVYKEQHKQLPTAETNPGLEKVIDAFNNLCSVSQATPDMVAAKLLPTKEGVRLTSCQSWFRGEWLEEYTLWCVRQTANPFINMSEKGLKYGTTLDDFELDIVALMGYQLFMISCVTTGDKDRAKEHLLEAYVRARQLGGDEARIALVCCYDDAPRLQNEVSRSWDAAGKIKVFGRNQLGNLTQHLSDWFLQANIE